MSDVENLQKMKEQLRIKNLELKKADSDKTKHQEKFKHILQISKKKIENLTEEITLERNFLRQPREYHLSGEAETKEKPKEEKTEEKPKEKTEKQEKYQENPKVLRAIQELRQRNQKLALRMKEEMREKDTANKRKDRLLQEIEHLRKFPNMIDKLKGKIAELEEVSRETQSSYERLIKEKEALSQSYRKVLNEQAGNVKRSESPPPDVVKELKEELEEIKAGKERLENELRVAKSKTNKDLVKEIERLQDVWEKQKMVLKQAKRKLRNFSEEAVEEPEAPLWMITYADMTTLLLTFFILYYSIAAMNVSKFKGAILGDESAGIGLLELMDSVDIKQSIQELTGLKSDNILTDINDVANDHETLEIGINKAKIVVRVPGGTLFKSAAAALQKEGLPVLDEVIRVVKKYPRYKVHIQGHTDDDPISTEQFPTNWELSAARATAVLRHFIDRGIEPQRLTATGYADTFPLFGNDTEAGRNKNRRVEFVLEKE